MAGPEEAVAIACCGPEVAAELLTLERRMLDARAGMP